jgi:hypothetical protein
LPVIVLRTNATMMKNQRIDRYCPEQMQERSSRGSAHSLIDETFKKGSPPCRLAVRRDLPGPTGRSKFVEAFSGLNRYCTRRTSQLLGKSPEKKRTAEIAFWCVAISNGAGCGLDDPRWKWTNLVGTAGKCDRIEEGLHRKRGTGERSI